MHAYMDKEMRDFLYKHFKLKKLEYKSQLVLFVKNET